MPELNLVEKVMALEAVELLGNLSPQQLARVASIAREVTYPPDKMILEQAQPADALYVIVDGAVEISGNAGALVTAHRHEVLGAWALFVEDPLPVKARTLEDTKLLRIARDEFYDLLSDNPEITAAIFTTLVKRFQKLVQA